MVQLRPLKKQTKDSEGKKSRVKIELLGPDGEKSLPEYLKDHPDAVLIINGKRFPRLKK